MFWYVYLVLYFIYSTINFYNKIQTHWIVSSDLPVFHLVVHHLFPFRTEK